MLLSRVRFPMFALREKSRNRWVRLAEMPRQKIADGDASGNLERRLKVRRGDIYNLSLHLGSNPGTLNMVSESGQGREAAALS